ncbi:MAG: hypothetical protein KUL86_10725 [Castellaniella sp.]|nr:hypothetical protein [Castellaniella sp.]
MRVRNIRTGVETDYPKRQALWLIGMGKCEEVKPAKRADVAVQESPASKEIVAAKPSKRQKYQTKDMKADVAVQESPESAQ